MPRPRNTVPTYRLHRASGQAVVSIPGRGDVYLGKHGTKESRERYARLVVDIAAARAPERRDALRYDTGPTVSEVCTAWLDKAERTYVNSSELGCYRPLLRRLNDLFGTSKASTFSAKDLRRLRDSLVADRRTRRSINRDVVRVRTIFRWCAAEELVPPTVAAGLGMLRGLRMGEDGVRESEPVRPVDDATLERTLPWLPPSLADFCRVLRLTGARPGELAELRPADLDMAGPVWWFKVPRHKSQWRGKERMVAIGPKAQAILRAYLERPIDRRCFLPRETWEERAAAREAARATPASCGNRRGTNRATEPRNRPGEKWETAAIGRALRGAIAAANVAAHAEAEKNGGPVLELPKWRLYQLRHSAATALRRTHGLEISANVMGHSSARLTADVYAERDLRQIADAIANTG